MRYRFITPARRFLFLDGVFYLTLDNVFHNFLTDLHYCILKEFLALASVLSFDFRNKGVILFFKTKSFV